MIPPAPRRPDPHAQFLAPPETPTPRRHLRATLYVLATLALLAAAAIPLLT